MALISKRRRALRWHHIMQFLRLVPDGRVLTLDVDIRTKKARLCLAKGLGRGFFDNEWIYEDIEAGYAKAAESGKPLLVAFR